MKFLLDDIQQGEIVVIASFDEMSVHLSKQTRNILSLHFGSQLINSVGNRDNFVFIGQKGVSLGAGYERIVQKRHNEPYPGEPAILQACIEFPRKFSS